MQSTTRPTSTDPLVALADRCVQCGLCLPACPTYGHDRLEAESPRGRIAIARGWALDTIEPTATGEAHLDHCLACRSCEAVCPAGVQYGELLVAARTRQRERRGPRLGELAIEALATRPRLLTRLLGGYRQAWRWLPRGWRRLPQPPARVRESMPGPASPATASRTVGLFVGCVADAYETRTRAALRRLCAALQVDVATPSGQGCCGSLHAHSGDTATADHLAVANRNAFAGAQSVLTLASGCHESLARALDHDSDRDNGSGNGACAGRAIDALDFLAAHLGQLRFAQCRERIAVHLPCTQRHVVRSVPALRRLLAAVPGLQVIELDAGFGCCGAAGTSMLTDPARADDYRRPLLDQLQACGATRLLSANIGCRLHLAGGTMLPVQHPVEFLAEICL